ncbi:flagellin, partial [Bacillus spizizenii]|nr:flagellin [Bacillus spizizenii]
MRINHNIAALNTLNRLSSNNGASQKNMEKLSSGLRINRAGDDAAGLAISEKMRGQIRGLEMASKNSQDGISLIQTAEGALTETHSILQRVRELVVQAGNTGTQDSTDLGAIQDEITSLVEEIGGGANSKGISDRTEFNGKKLLNGAFSEASG